MSPRLFLICGGGKYTYKDDNGTDAHQDLLEVSPIRVPIFITDWINLIKTFLGGLLNRVMEI